MRGMWGGWVWVACEDLKRLEGGVDGKVASC